MVKVHTPVKGFTGTSAGVAFADGVGETDDPNALAYFKRHGYEVEDKKAAAKPSEPKPAKKAAAKPSEK